MNPDISIIICTYNRADSLRDTLKVLGSAQIPNQMHCELIIIDNGSTDSTREVAENTKLPNMDVRYIYETRRGKCFAYNTALAAINGRFLLLTDDDVRVPSNWVVEMVVEMSEKNSDVVQGGIKLPPHLKKRLTSVRERSRFTELLPSTVGVSDRSILVGANMAFQRRVLERVPAFDVELGPGKLGFGDDVLLGLQLTQAGFKIVQRLDVAVEHHFDSSRLRREYVLSESGRRGACSAYISYHWEHTDFRWLRLRLLWQYLKLYKSRTTSWGKTRDCGIGEEEDLYASRIGFYERLLLERKKQRNYRWRGLVKTQGVLPIIPATALINATESGQKKCGNQV